MTRSRLLFEIGLAILSSAVVVSCATNHSKNSSHDANNTIQPQNESGLHATYSTQLMSIMDRLQKETIEHWPENMADEQTAPKPKDDKTAFADARPLADALAKAADEIPRSVSHLVMLEADRRAFEAQAATLREQAQRLGAAARNHDRKKMQQVLDSINATCQSCHARFLDVSGPLSRL